MAQTVPEESGLMLPEEFEQAAAELESPEISAFRASGGRVLGFFCSYVPEELLNVGGLASFRMRAPGAGPCETADSLMGLFNCSYTRHCLEKGLAGEYRFLDGFVFVPGCDHMRRLYDNWAYFADPPFLALLDVPHLRDEDALGWYRDEIEALWNKISKAFSLSPDAGTVWEGIQKTNRCRKLLEQIDRLRWEGPARLSGRQMQVISLYAASTPKDLAIPALERFLETLRSASGALQGQHRARILLVGSHLDDPAFIELLEDTGALVVRDAYCCGLRDQLGPVEGSESKDDPFLVLARRYLDRLSCPRMYADYPRRLETLAQMAREARVDGIVLEQMKFCETWGVDGNLLQRDLKELGLPVLRIEREYLLSGLGQIRTRVQAFLESLGK